MDTDPLAARADLDRSRAAHDLLTSRGRWLRTPLLVFGIASIVLVLAVGLGGIVGMVGGSAMWLILIAVMVPWANSQPVTLRACRRRHAWALGVWGVLYWLTLLVGLLWFQGVPRFWVPGALITAVPFLVAALRPVRSTGEA